MTTEWSHLPNAAHIDRVLASAKAHPEEWIGAAQAVRAVFGNTAWRAAWDAAWGAAWDAAWDAARGAAWDAAGDASWGAITALIVWDHSVKYLDMPSDQLEVWAVLSDAPACVLLLPAVRAFEKINELEIA